ncbi:MAG: sugar phosphate isomerase/epimerase family protein [Planctomycetota bacterium]|jgi:sugar phosphate isomerase/epimerase
MEIYSHDSSSVLTRRVFLQAGSVAIASIGCRGKIVGPVGNSSKTRITVGAHVWVYAAKQPEYNVTPVLPQIFSDLKYAQIDGVELMHNVLRKRETVERIGELSEKYELPVIGTSFSGPMWNRDKYEAVLEDAEIVIGYLAKLKGKTFGVSVGAAPQKKTVQQLDIQADLLRKIMAIAEKHHVTVNLHNHTYEVVDDLHDLKGTLSRIPDVKLGPDLNWLVRGGVDPVWFIRKYGEQIVFLHLRDQYKDGRWSESLGEGNMDYAAIGKALRDIKFSGIAVIELAHENKFEITRPLRESWKISRQYVRQVLG